MIGLKSVLNVIDNSGALLAECVNVIKSGKYAAIGDEITVVIQKARPIIATAAASANAPKVRKGDVRRALIVRTKKGVSRRDGSILRFDDNACVLLNNKQEPAGSRITGTVAMEVKQKKILSLASKVL